jgi:hypothetical protein
MLWMNPIMDMQKTMTDANDQRAVLVGGWLQTLQAMTIAFYSMAVFTGALTLATLVNMITVIF